MLGEMIQKKLEFLRHPKREILAKGLCECFLTIASRLRGDLDLPLPLLKIMEVDLIYTLVRNAHWSHASIFKDAVVDFLKSEYRLPTTITQILLTPMLHRLEDLMNSNQKTGATFANRCSTEWDKDFLRYVFVATAAAHDDESLLSELGLGRGMLARIRQGVTTACRLGIKQEQVEANATSGQRSVAEIVFVPEIDALFSDLMIEIGRAGKDRPWIMDLYRLRYELLDITEPWQSIVAEDGVDWLFELMLAMGGPGTLFQPDIDRALLQVLPGYSLSSRAGSELMTALKEIDLVMPLGGGKMPDPSIPRWRLLPKAEALTADAFAHLMMREQEALPAPWKNLTIIKLATFSPAYQAAILKILPVGLQEDLVVQIVSGDPKIMSPQALSYALQQLPRFADQAGHEAFLLKALERHKTPWHRKVIIEHWRRVPEALLVAQVLVQVAQSDPSPMVRDVAAAALSQWQKETSETPGNLGTELILFDGRLTR